MTIFFGTLFARGILGCSRSYVKKFWHGNCKAHFDNDSHYHLDFGQKKDSPISKVSGKKGVLVLGVLLSSRWCAWELF